MSGTFRYVSAEEEMMSVSEVELQVLDQIEALLHGDMPGAAAEGLRDARIRAQALGATVADPAEGARLAGLTFAAETLAASWIDRQWSADDIERLVQGIADGVDIDPSAVRTSV